MSERYWWYLFLQRSEELRLYNHGLEFDDFELWLKSGIFKCISWLNGSFFEGDDWDFMNEEVKTLSNGTKDLI
jgi:hypothetical protein